MLQCYLPQEQVKSIDGLLIVIGKMLERELKTKDLVMIFDTKVSFNDKFNDHIDYITARAYSMYANLSIWNCSHHNDWNRVHFSFSNYWRKGTEVPQLRSKLKLINEQRRALHNNGIERSIQNLCENGVSRVRFRTNEKETPNFHCAKVLLIEVVSLFHFWLFRDSPKSEVTLYIHLWKIFFNWNK